MKNVKPTIKFTGIFIQDQSDGGFTGFLTQMPGAVAEGDTEDEVQENLFRTLPDYLEVENKIIEEVRLVDGGANIIRKEFEFQLTT